MVHEMLSDVCPQALLDYLVIAAVFPRSLSGILCLRHNMTDRSIYAEQDEIEECGHSGQDGGAAEDPQRAD